MKNNGKISARIDKHGARTVMLQAQKEIASQLLPDGSMKLATLRQWLHQSEFRWAGNNVLVHNVYGNLGIHTESGVFWICERNGELTVTLDGDIVWWQGRAGITASSTRDDPEHDQIDWITSLIAEIGPERALRQALDAVMSKTPGVRVMSNHESRLSHEQGNHELPVQATIDHSTLMVWLGCLYVMAERSLGELILREVYSGIGIYTDQALFGFAERDGGLEVMVNGDIVWSSATALGR